MAFFRSFSLLNRGLAPVFGAVSLVAIMAVNGCSRDQNKQGPASASLGPALSVTDTLAQDNFQRLLDVPEVRVAYEKAQAAKQDRSNPDAFADAFFAFVMATNRYAPEWASWETDLDRTLLVGLGQDPDAFFKSLKERGPSPGP
jgi:hypothetical protein